VYFVSFIGKVKIRRIIRRIVRRIKTFVCEPFLVGFVKSLQSFDVSCSLGLEQIVIVLGYSVQGTWDTLWSKMEIAFRVRVNVKSNRGKLLCNVQGVLERGFFV
jgi:hypothetical protein